MIRVIGWPPRVLVCRRHVHHVWMALLWYALDRNRYRRAVAVAWGLQDWADRRDWVRDLLVPESPR